jgi:hypothetical protein
MQAIKTFGFIPQLVASRDGDGRMRVEGIGSSTVRDHHGDTFSLKALQKMAAASKGMVVFMNHGYEVPKDVFGQIEAVRLSKTGDVDERTQQEIWDLRLGILVDGSNPDAVKNFQLIDEDKINLGISVGAMLPEGGYTVDKDAGGRLLIDDVEPIEFSMVGIPANPRSFVDYAIKSIVGVFPDSKKWNVAWDRFLVKAEQPRVEDSEDDETAGSAADDTAPEITEADDEPAKPIDPKEITAPLETVEGEAVQDSLPSKGIEVKEGETAELIVNKDGTSSGAIVGSDDHNRLGEPLELAAEHPDLEKAKTKTHVHPHAHVHDHEHEHGYGDSVTKHAHEHAHSHSHDHAADHDHADTMDDYSHNHPHNGSYDNEDHAHGNDAVKAESKPALEKSKVSIWENPDGSKVVEVDTGRSKPKADGEDQSAQASLMPDTTGGRGDAEGGSEDDSDLRAAEALVSKSHSDAGILLQKVIGQLNAVKSEAESLRKERDAAIEIAKRTMDGTREILKRVGELPVGRKAAGFGGIADEFDDLSSIYDADVRKHLTPAKRS